MLLNSNFEEWRIQNPDLPFDLSIKFRLLEELAALARKLGRTVECYYY